MTERWAGPGPSPDDDPEAMVAAFAQSPTPLIVVVGPDLVVCAASEGTKRLTPGKDLIGLPLSTAYGELLGQQAVELFEQCYRTGEPVQGREWRFEIETSPGTREVLFLDFLFFPWLGADGEIRGVISHTTDVTGLVAARLAEERAREAAEGRYRDALALSTALQSALLPRDLPILPGLDVGAHYLLAASDTAAGGDWFDTVAHPDGTVTLVVGDVVGHGVVAAATMGQLRAVLRERLLTSPDTLAALQALDRFARTVPEAHAATVCLARVDPSTGAVDHCAAGHPPPLVVGPDGVAVFLERPQGPPLATTGGFAVSRSELEPDALLLLYTDGVIERPGRDPAQATAELIGVVEDAYAGRGYVLDVPTRTVERVCRLGIELLTRLSGHSDDVTLLAAQRTPRIAPLDLDLPADPRAVATVRAELALWLQALQVPGADEMIVQHSIGELVANAVTHAYEDHGRAEPDDPDDPDGREHRRVRTLVDLDALGRLRASVVDQGRWSAGVPREDDPHRLGGRGLAITRAMVDELRIDRAESGTTATVLHALARPAQLLTATDTTSAVGHTPDQDWPGHFQATVDTGPGAALQATPEFLRVRGPVDVLTAGRLRNAILTATRGGTRPLVLDLDEVSLLASAGVRVLHELAGDHLVLVAAPGTTAHHVLDLVQLPHRPTVGDR